jgi:hypothetical protein
VQAALAAARSAQPTLRLPVDPERLRAH